MATEETTEDDFEEEAPKPYNDFDLTSLEELPPELAPISTIIEIVRHIESLKETWRPQFQQENEFLRLLRQLRSRDKIFTCSHTL